MATAGSGTIGLVTGTSTTNVTATAGTAGSTAKSQGIENSNQRAGYAYGYTAVAAPGTITGLLGTASDTISATNSTAGNIAASYVYGVGDSYAGAGTASGPATAGASSTGAAGTIGTVSGGATVSLTGTDTAPGGNIQAYHNAGIEDTTLSAGYAYGFSTAKAGTGSISTANGISGTLSETINGTANNSTGGVYARHNSGIEGLDIYAGAATTSDIFKTHGPVVTSATGNTGTVGAINGTATVNMTGVTTGSGSVTDNYSHGITHLTVQAGSATSNKSGALASTAYAGAGTIGAVTGSITTSLTGTSNATAAATGTVGAKYNDGMTHIELSAGYAHAAYNYKGAKAIGATGIIGAVTGSSSLTVGGNTTNGNIYGDHSVGVK